MLMLMKPSYHHLQAVVRAAAEGGYDKNNNGAEEEENTKNNTNQQQQGTWFPQCLQVLPLLPSCRFHVIAGAQRLDACLARSVAELREDTDDLIFGPGWPRGVWPRPRTTIANVTTSRGDWLARESPAAVAAVLSSILSKKRYTKSTPACCAPIQFLGAGTYGIVFAGSSEGSSSVALKFVVPCPFTWFNPRHEFEMQAYMASAGAALGVSELLNEARADGIIAHKIAWKKGERGYEFLTNPTLDRLREAVKDWACVLIMERSNGNLADHFTKGIWMASSPEEHGDAVGVALAKLLATVRDIGVVHNDAKVDNIGCLTQWNTNQDGVPLFRFLDCGLSFRAETLTGLPLYKRNAIILEGNVRDGCTLIGSLILLARALQGDKQRKACVATAWKLAKEMPECCCSLTHHHHQCNDLRELEQAVCRRAREACCVLRRALRKGLLSTDVAIKKKRLLPPCPHQSVSRAREITVTTQPSTCSTNPHTIDSLQTLSECSETN